MATSQKKKGKKNEFFSKSFFFAEISAWKKNCFFLGDNVYTSTKKGLLVSNSLIHSYMPSQIQKMQKFLLFFFQNFSIFGQNFAYVPNITYGCCLHYYSLQSVKKSFSTSPSTYVVSYFAHMSSKIEKSAKIWVVFKVFFFCRNFWGQKNIFFKISLRSLFLSKKGLLSVI